jgi:multicomponent Na+:H+ antiporter subunit A
MMDATDMPLALPLAAVMLAAGLAAFLDGRRAALAGCGMGGLAFLAYALVLPAVAAGPVASGFWAVPSLGVTGGLRLDGLSLLFALLITGIGALVLLYAGATSRATRASGAWSCCCCCSCRRCWAQSQPMTWSRCSCSGS